MKKLIFPLLALIIISTKTFAQDLSNTKANNNFNEIKLNALFLIVGALEIGYEKTLNEESGIGFSVFLPIDNDVSDEIKFNISPYYRFYFGEKYAAGFFVEGFGMLNSTNRNIDLFNSEEDDFRLDFALGFAVGGKWVTKRGFSIELFGGIGRNLLNNRNSDYDIIGKGGVNFGYRF